MWVEQSYKQVKHVLGWSNYQVRSDLSIRHHCQLECVAFSFCWSAFGRLPASLEEPEALKEPEDKKSSSFREGREGKRRARVYS
jgi:hypothetical protein